MNEPIRLVVFDLDGTLIDSNRLKYDAFFGLFPDTLEHRRAVQTVLDDHLEESRFVILGRILDRLGSNVAPTETVGALAERYGALVLEGAKRCPEIRGAGETLATLAGRCPAYLVSTTPHAAVQEIVACRGWTRFFRGLFGYPHDKTHTIGAILAKESVRAAEALVAGDRASDERAAAANGCHFFRVNAAAGLCGLLERVGSVGGTR